MQKMSLVVRLQRSFFSFQAAHEFFVLKFRLYARGTYSSMVTKTFPRYLFQARKHFPAFGKLEVSLVRFLAPSSLSALANKGFFEVTRHPSLTQAVSSSSAETTENPAVVR